MTMSLVALFSRPEEVNGSQICLADGGRASTPCLACERAYGPG